MRVWCLILRVGGSSFIIVWLIVVIIFDELNDVCYLYIKCLFSIKEINKLFNCLNFFLYYIMVYNIIFLYKY